MTTSSMIGVLATAGLLLSGCAATIAQTAPYSAWIIEEGAYLDRHPTASMTQFHVAARARAVELMSEPMTLNAALEVAMLNDQELQRLYQDYRVFDQAFVVRLAAARESADSAEATEWTTLRVVWPTLKAEVQRHSRRAASSYAFADEYVEVAQRFLEVAAQVRRSYYHAVAARQVDATLQRVVDAFQAEAELANEQYLAGTLPRGEQGKRHLAYARAIKEHAAARQDLVEARETLTRSLGLWGDIAHWTLPERLPDLPPAAPYFDLLEDYALTHRLDLIESRQGSGAWTKAVNVRSEVRERYARLLYAYDLARYQRDTVVPLSQTVLQEAQKEYNGMLIGVYDLLAEAREHVEAGQEYVETLRDYWIAEGELTQAVGGQLPVQF